MMVYVNQATINYCIHCGDGFPNTRGAFYCTQCHGKVTQIKSELEDKNERLEAENKRLRETLREYEAAMVSVGNMADAATNAIKHGRAALSKKEGK
jgi:uncharacterized Zn finger protein (UPF0148 family)